MLRTLGQTRLISLRSIKQILEKLFKTLLLLYFLDPTIPMIITLTLPQGLAFKEKGNFLSLFSKALGQMSLLVEEAREMRQCM